jgi:hypothetical protein
VPLTAPQVTILRTAIESYGFPAAYFDFAANAPVLGLSMSHVEACIRDDLVCGIPSRVKNGLSNVLYWGFAQMGGLAAVRAGRFRIGVTAGQLQAATQMFANTARPRLEDIALLRMPQFSGVSFVSKVRMFLDPLNSATLDNQIMKIHAARPTTVLAGVRQRGGTIPVNRTNSEAYEAWCDRLGYIKSTYLPSVRVVDIERGIFHLVQSGHIACAAELIGDA